MQDGPRYSKNTVPFSNRVSTEPTLDLTSALPLGFGTRLVPAMSRGQRTLSPRTRSSSLRLSHQGAGDGAGSNEDYTRICTDRHGPISQDQNHRSKQKKQASMNHSKNKSFPAPPTSNLHPPRQVGYCLRDNDADEWHCNLNVDK